jgi:flagellum-specific peptidoglycan hydrolase FlgJ
VWFVIGGGALLVAGVSLIATKGVEAVMGTFTGKKGFVQSLAIAMRAMGYSENTIAMAAAHAGVETAMGTKGKAISGNNFWNISAGTVSNPSKDWIGPVILGPDKEPAGKDASGNTIWKDITQRWRVWSDMGSAVAGYFQFLSGARYPRSMAALKAGDPNAFVVALHDEGYYTWPVEDFVDSKGKHSGYRSMFMGQYNLAKQYLA